MTNANTALIGRNEAIEILTTAYKSIRPSLISVVGRRRIGKTFLIRNVFREQIQFSITGIAKASKQEQLINFRLQLIKAFGELHIPDAFANWLEAFAFLTQRLDNTLPASPEKRVLFFDELPWLASHKSGFLNAFSWFWNSWAADRRVTVVICGSAASWMIRKVVNNRGDLHNRVTHRIQLNPFTLAEVGSYMDAHGIVEDQYQRAQLYMSFGGVPFYLEQMLAGESAVQTIQRILYAPNAPLATEFELLYSSLFDDAKHHLSIVKVLAKKQIGMTREALRQAAKIKSSGTLSRVLEELELSGFIMRSTPFGKTRNDALYRLIDEFSRFYLAFIDGNPRGKIRFPEVAQSPSYRAWVGYAFENIALRNTDAFKRALGIHGIASIDSSYIAKANDTSDGVQVDLLLDRADRIISLIEAKFTDSPFDLSKEYAQKLRIKRSRFIAHTNTRKQVFIAMLTTFGLGSTRHSVGIVDHVITLDALF